MFNPKYAESAYYFHFMKVGRHFGYELDQEGSCQGFDHAGLAALISGEFDTYEKALAAITQIEIKELRHTTLPAYQCAQTRKRSALANHLQLAVPLIRNVSLNQDPENYPLLINSASDESIEQQAINIDAREKIVFSNNLAFYGCYTRRSFKQAMDALQERVKDIAFPFGVVLVSQEHAIALGRDKAPWLLIDLNSLPVKRCQDTKAIVAEVFSGFTGFSNKFSKGFEIGFSIVVKKKDQALLEKTLLPWKNEQYAQCFNDFKMLSREDQNVVFCKATKENDERILSFMEVNPPKEFFGIMRYLDCTLLYLCAVYNNIAMAKRLLAYEHIDVNLGYGAITPLHAAVQSGNTTIVALLLNHPKIDTSIMCEGNSAKCIAKLEKHQGILSLFQEHEKIKNEQSKNKKQKMN